MIRSNQLKLLFLLLSVGVLSLSGCQFSDSSSYAECFSYTDCAEEDVCFLGRCVDGNYAITDVDTELTPPANTPYLTQQTSYPQGDNADGWQILLAEPLKLYGNVVAEGSILGSDSVTGQLVATQLDGAIDGRAVIRETTVTSEGFNLNLLNGSYRFLFIPSKTELPPVEYHRLGLPITDGGQFDIPYPATNELIQLTGRIRFSETLATPVAGASVSGSALDSGGNVLTSTTDISGDDGTFQIAFPPGALSISVTVRPGENTLLPEVSFSNLELTTLPESQILSTGDLALGISDEGFLDLSANIRSSNGEPISGATVIFEGEVANNGTYSTTGSSLADGSITSVLLPGEYKITVSPPRSQSEALTVYSLSIPTSGDVLLTLNDKVLISGYLHNHDGQSVAGARIACRRRGSVTQRMFNTTSNESGYFEALVDPGTPEDPAVYELSVEPDLSSGLPRYFELMYVSDHDIQNDIRLYEPTFLYGRVLTPESEPLAEVILAFYSRDLGDDGRPLLVGVVQSDFNGEFVLPLPTPDL